MEAHNQCQTERYFPGDLHIHLQFCPFTENGPTVKMKVRRRGLGRQENLVLVGDLLTPSEWLIVFVVRWKRSILQNLSISVNVCHICCGIARGNAVLPHSFDMQCNVHWHAMQRNSLPVTWGDSYRGRLTNLGKMKSCLTFVFNSPTFRVNKHQLFKQACLIHCKLPKARLTFTPLNQRAR